MSELKSKHRYKLILRSQEYYFFKGNTFFYTGVSWSTSSILLSLHPFGSPNGDFYEEFSTCYVESVVNTTKTGH